MLIPGLSSHHLHHRTATRLTAAEARETLRSDECDYFSLHRNQEASSARLETELPREVLEEWLGSIGSEEVDAKDWRWKALPILLRRGQISTQVVKGLKPQLARLSPGDLGRDLDKLRLSALESAGPDSDPLQMVAIGVLATDPRASAHCRRWVEQVDQGESELRRLVEEGTAEERLAAARVLWEVNDSREPLARQVVKFATKISKTEFGREVLDNVHQQFLSKLRGGDTEELLDLFREWNAEVQYSLPEESRQDFFRAVKSELPENLASLMDHPKVGNNTILWALREGPKEWREEQASLMKLGMDLAAETRVFSRNYKELVKQIGSRPYREIEQEARQVYHKANQQYVHGRSVGARDFRIEVLPDGKARVGTFNMEIEESLSLQRLCRDTGFHSPQLLLESYQFSSEELFERLASKEVTDSHYVSDAIILWRRTRDDAEGRSRLIEALPVEVDAKEWAYGLMKALQGHQRSVFEARVQEAESASELLKISRDWFGEAQVNENEPWAQRIGARASDLGLDSMAALLRSESGEERLRALTFSKLGELSLPVLELALEVADLDAFREFALEKRTGTFEELRREFLEEQLSLGAESAENEWIFSDDGIDMGGHFLERKD